MGSYYVPAGHGAFEDTDTLNRFVEHNPGGCWRASCKVGCLIDDCEDCPFKDCKFEKANEYTYRRLFEEWKGVRVSESALASYRKSHKFK